LNTLLVLSFILEGAATSWAVYLLWKVRDWRIGVLAVFLLLMTIRKVIILIGIDAAGHWENLALREFMDYIILAISIMAVVAVGGLHLYIAKRGREELDLRMLSQGLADSVAPVLITDADMTAPGPTIVFVNDAMCTLSGYTREELIGKSPRLLQGPLTDRTTMQRLREELAAGRTFIGETVNYKRDGTPYWVHWSISPVRDDRGRLTNYISLQKDISAQHQKDLSLRDALDQLRFHVDNAPIGVVEWDQEFRVSLWSHGAERLFGWKADEVIGKHPSEWRIILPEDEPPVNEVIRQLQSAEKLRNTSINRNLTRDGGVIWCHWHNSVRFDPDGKLDSILSFVQDVTERVEAEDRQRLLMLELDHRVKNNLTTVIGIAVQTLSSAHSLEDFGQSFIGRIESLSRAHGLLAKASWDGIDLTELCRRILQPYMIEPNIQITLEGPSVSLSSAEGTYLALFLHELMTNAVKYGALSVTAGCVHVSWMVDSGADGPLLNLCWKELNGPPVKHPTRTGFGTELMMSGIKYELGGRASLDYDALGLQCRMTVPLKRHGVQAAPTRTKGQELPHDSEP